MMAQEPCVLLSLEVQLKRENLSVTLVATVKQRASRKPRGIHAVILMVAAAEY